MIELGHNLVALRNLSVLKDARCDLEGVRLAAENRVIFENLRLDKVKGNIKWKRLFAQRTLCAVGEWYRSFSHLLHLRLGP